MKGQNIMELKNALLEIQNQLDKHTFSQYAILVGYGDREWQYMSEGVDLDSYFDAASIGKVFPTSALALHAISEGLLSLDDTLGKYFPGVPENKNNITVKNLMTHTSGLFRRRYPEKLGLRGREGVADFIFSNPLAYETGSHFAYCCDGIMLLGFIVEKVFGMTLEKAFETYVKKPLGMTRSTYHIKIDEENMVMCNHRSDLGGLIYDDSNVRELCGIPAGNGGNFITAGDLQKFVKALIRKDPCLYSDEIFALAEQNYTGGLPMLDTNRSTENYGLGFVYVNEACLQARDLFPEGSIGHCGWTGQSFYLNRELGLYVIILSDSMRSLCLNYPKGNHDDKVHQMRIHIHRAVKKDLGL